MPRKKRSVRKGLVLRNAKAKLSIILIEAEYCVGCLHTMGLLFLRAPCFSSVDYRELLLIYASGKGEALISPGVSPAGHGCVGDACQAHCLLQRFAFGQPLQLGDASQLPGSSILHRWY